MALAQPPKNIFNKLSVDTLKEVAVEGKFHKDDQELEEMKKRDLVNELSHEVECFGIKKLTQMMKRNTLSEICDFHEIDHKDNNPMNKAVLTKRVYEQMTSVGVKKWLSKCKDEEIITQICEDMEIEYTEVDSNQELKDLIEQYIFDFGAQVFFNKLQLKTLRECAGDMKLKNRNVNSRARLCQAVMTVSDVEVPKKKKAAKKTKKAPIRRATDKNMLMQHYYASELKDWCEENGLKISGNKKTLAERIVAYNNGDKENTMATERPVRKTKKTTKKQTKKQTKKPSRSSSRKKKVEEEVEEEVEEVEEEEVEEEEQEVEQQQEEEVDEDNFDVSDDEEEEEADEEMEDEEEQEDLSGKVLVFEKGAEFSYDLDDLKHVVKELGAKIRTSLNKTVTHYVVEDVEASTKLIKKARTMNIEVVTDDFLKEFIDDEDDE